LACFRVGWVCQRQLGFLVKQCLSNRERWEEAEERGREATKAGKGTWNGEREREREKEGAFLLVIYKLCQTTVTGEHMTLTFDVRTGPLETRVIFKPASKYFSHNQMTLCRR